METTKGIITRVISHDPQTGDFFASFVPEGAPPGTKLALAGSKRHLSPGDFVCAQDAVRTKGKSGEVIRSRFVRPDIPDTAAGSAQWFRQLFLGKHGVTDASIQAFVRKHGDGAAAACRRDPKLVTGLSSSPSAFGAKLLSEWLSRTSASRAALLLESAKLDRRVITAVLDAIEKDVFDVLQQNPYRISRIKAVGFENASKVADKFNIPKHDDRRIEAALMAVLDDLRSSGHTFGKAKSVGTTLTKKYEIEKDAAIDFIARRRTAPDSPFRTEIRDSDLRLIPSDLFQAETQAANAIARLLARGRRNPSADAARVADRLFAEKEFSKFDEVQRRAAMMALQEPVSILTGGPGTGKSTVSKVIVAGAEMLDRNVILCAPTGKAAKRLAKATGREAHTIHTVLLAKALPGGGSSFGRNADNPLRSGSFVLVDEASMIDAVLMKALMEAMPPDGRLLFVGDRNQLPSVDAGAVLADLISARDAAGHPLVPSCELVNVYRQGKTSQIATGAGLIKSGSVPPLSDRTDGDVTFIECTAHGITDQIVNVVDLLRQEFDADARSIAILAPQRTGPGGTDEINSRLQEFLNEDRRAIKGVERSPRDNAEEPVPRIGDRVMLTENDPENGVMNGDIGTIVDATTTKSGNGERTTMEIVFDGGLRVVYPASKWRKLLLGYGITIHKSQGSEFPFVIMPVTMKHERLLDRSLIYTGWTRAKTRLFLVGEPEALEHAIATTDASRRDTRLSELLAASAASLGLRGRPDGRPKPTPSAPARPDPAATAPQLPRPPSLAGKPSQAAAPARVAPPMRPMRPLAPPRPAVPATDGQAVRAAPALRPMRPPPAPRPAAVIPSESVPVEQPPSASPQPKPAARPARFMRPPKLVEPPDEPGPSMR